MAQEKVALITAGGSGQGAAAARRLAQDGYQVAILSSSGKGEALANELGGVGVTGSNQSNDDLKRLVDVMDGADRLSLTFRFEDGSSTLDAHSRENLADLALLLEAG